MPGVDDQVHRLLHPFGRLLCSEVVKDQQIGAHDRTQDFELRGANRRVVGTANDPQQVADIVKQAARARGLDGLLEHGDGEVRLADARLAFEQEPFRNDRERIGDAPRLGDGFLERFVARREIAERAVLVALGMFASRRR